MPVPWWLPYVGALTGFAGIILSIVSLRRTSKLKALDLRLQLRRQIVIVTESLSELPKKIEYASGSRIAVASENGLLRSGAIDVFKERVSQDLNTAGELASRLPRSADNFRGKSSGELEDLLVLVHGIETEIARLESRYKAEIAKDDQDREHIRRRYEAQRGV